MNDIILQYIKNEIASEPLEDLDSNEDLLESGVIDSIGMVKLISFFEEKFQIKVPPEDMTVENFMTVEHIVDYLSNK